MVRLSLLISRIVSYFCIAALFAASPRTAAGIENAERTLSLGNCIELALNNATSAKKSDLNLKLRGSDVLRSYGNFLPHISVSAGYAPYTLNRTYISADPVAQVHKTAIQSVDMTLVTSLNLFNGFSDYASLQSSLKQEHAAAYTLRRALESVVYDVTQAYFQVLLNQELLGIARENLLSAQDQLTLTDRQFQIGLKSITDRYQQQADAAESALSVIKAETRMQRSMFELLRRLQIDPQTKITLIADPEELKAPLSSKIDIDSLATVALKQRNDLKSKVFETDAAKWQVRMSRASWYPKIDLNFNVSTGGTDYLHHEYSYPPLSEQLSNTVGYSVALNVNWAIFDGFQTRYNVESAKINHLNQQLDYNDLKRNIVIDIKQAAGEYTSAFMQIETAKVSLTAAQSAYEGIKRKYELGASGFVELSTARATLFNARSSLSQANYNLALQKSVLDFATGNTSIP
jgi:outer membrane protein